VVSGVTQGALTMKRTLSTLSLALACGIAAAAETPPVQTIDEPLTMNSFGKLEKGGNRFSPVYTFQQIPAKPRAIAKTEKKPAAKTEPVPAPAQSDGRGDVQEL
jgi:hypothetical protein